MIDDTARENFQSTVWDFYREHGRHDLPWRQPEANGDFAAYKIMVSEIMLQQTQVTRVIDKYQEFVGRFPTVDALAEAKLGDVLRVWSGLGYNRRAKYLHAAARMIIDDFQGDLPETTDLLTMLPGVGVNTAGAISTYAFNQPSLFIETNIRTVYIHHFFDDEQNIDDKHILNMLSITLDKDSSREWYWALMDYGSYLKKSGIRRNHQSKHYSKQSAFEGSKRQIRGEVLRQLKNEPLSAAQLSKQIEDERLNSVIDELLKEGLIRKYKNRLTL